MTQQTAAAHTPGPWKVSGLRSDQDACLSIVSVETGFDVAEIAYTNGPELADARLIAAAPALLGALRGLLLLRGSGQAYDRDKAWTIGLDAIALATPEEATQESEVGK